MTAPEFKTLIDEAVDAIRGVLDDGRIIANWGVRPNDLPAPPTS